MQSVHGRNQLKCMHGTYKSTGGDNVEPKKMHNSFYKNGYLLDVAILSNTDK